MGPNILETIQCITPRSVTRVDEPVEMNISLYVFSNCSVIIVSALHPNPSATGKIAH